MSHDSQNETAGPTDGVGLAARRDRIEARLEALSAQLGRAVRLATLAAARAEIATRREDGSDDQQRPM